MFAPSPEEIEQALRLAQAFEAHQAAGAGAFELDGKMVDLPLMRASNTTLLPSGVNVYSVASPNGFDGTSASRAAAGSRSAWN